MPRLALPLALLLLVTACERRTTVRFEGGNPPTFVLAGSGTLGGLLIYDPGQEQVADPFDQKYVLWQIEPISHATGMPVKDLHKITYGTVPNGCKQIRPEIGSPPPLVDGKRYRYWVVTADAPHAGGYFMMQDGKPIPVTGP